MDRATRAVRRSASKLTCSDESQFDLKVTLQEFRQVKDVVKTLTDVQRNATEHLLKWSLHENNRAIKDVALQLNELTALWGDAQTDFSQRVVDMVDQLETVLQTDRSVKETEKQAALLLEKENKQRKEVKKALKWRKGGDIRLLELKVNEICEQRQTMERCIEESRIEQETVKMIRFKSAMVKLAEAYLSMATSCGIIFDAQHDIASRMPDPTDSVRDMQYNGAPYTRERVEMARLRLASLDLASTGATRDRRLQRRSDPGRFPLCRAVLDAPPPYCQFDPNQSSGSAN